MSDVDDVVEAPDMTYNDLPLVLVRVSAIVTFDAFMVADGTDGKPNGFTQVAANIADAIEHHAGRLQATEDGDALCVVATDVAVLENTFDIVPCTDTAEEIETMVDGMAAETF